MKIKIINKSNNSLPQYETEGAGAIDLKADDGLPEHYHICWIEPGERKLIKTNLFIEIPQGYILEICSRSGLALKNGIQVLNAPGIIDSDYRGNIGIILLNTSDSPFQIRQGDRIAQAILKKVEKIEFEEVEELDNTERGSGGFGHTGR